MQFFTAHFFVVLLSLLPVAQGTTSHGIAHPIFAIEKNDTELHSCTIQLYSNRNGATISVKVPVFQCVNLSDPMIPKQLYTFHDLVHFHTDVIIYSVSRIAAMEVREPCVCRLTYQASDCSYARNRSGWVAPRSGKMFLNERPGGLSCNGPYSVGVLRT
ncbi:hypothetical protein B0J11DRAFT_582126 [Dendryphion nanum]|uniref:Secreted protein n=1 Tax=Dendryphion nanum TaxID=256645 RepID=A0A9P9IGW7_9PLEO|nr:hypothetical protein B0J11DRAFT_582126 [Dendryphion nanum]